VPLTKSWSTSPVSFLYIDLKQHQILRSMRRFAEEVMPAFRDEYVPRPTPTGRAPAVPSIVEPCALEQDV